MDNINSKINSARTSLRKIHDKYIKQFHEIHLKIDKYLEELEVQNE